MDYPAIGPDADTPVLNNRQLNRRHRRVSYPVSRKVPNQEPLQILGFLVGL